MWTTKPICSVYVSSKLLSDNKENIQNDTKSYGFWYFIQYPIHSNFDICIYKSLSIHWVIHGFHLFQKVAKTGAVDRLTDTTKYTGSHKERFDDSGKGKGKAGREELVENTGYVGAYKNAGTYEEKTKDN